MADSAGGKEVGRISIRVVPNLKGFYRELKAKLEEIESSLKAKIPVEPDMGNFRQEVAAKTKGMRTKVKVDPDVDKGFFSRIGQMIGNIQGPSFGSGINPAGYVAIFAAITAVAAPLMGLLTSALLSLPGLIAAIGVPIGALVLGMKGLAEAAGVLLLPLEGLQKVMNAKVQEQFTPMFTKLANALPALSDSLPKVTQGLADMGNAFVDTITSAPGMARIQGTISNIAKALSAASPGIASFTDGLLTLAEKFTSKLPNVSEWFNKAGDDFKNWINKLNADGTLDKAFEGLGSTLKTLLEGVGGILKSGLDFFKDPKNIQDFNAGLKSIGDSLQSIVNLSNSLNNLGDLFKGLLPNFDMSAFTKDLFAPFTSPDAGWRTMFESIKTAWNETVLSLQQTGQFLAAWFFTFWNTIKTSATGLWDGITAAASAAWAGVQNAVSAAWQGITGAAAAGAQGVVTAISSAWSSLAGIASAAFGSLVGVVTNVMAQALAAVVSGVGQIVAEIAALGGKIAAAAGNMGGALVGAGKALMDGLLSGIRAGLQAVLSFASGIAAKIAAVKGPLPKDRKELIPAGNALMEGLGTGLDQGLDPVLGKAKAIAKQIFEAFKETFGSAPQALSLNLGNLQSGMASLTDTTKDFSKAMAPTADLAKGSSLVNPEDKQDIADLKQQLKDLELQRKRLAVEKDQAGSKEEKKRIQGEIDKINEQKRAIDLRKTELGAMQDQTSELGKQKTLGQTIGDMIADAWQGGVDGIANFGRANLDQAMSDLGIGGGALTNALDQGMDWAQKLAGNVFNIQVSSVDDAIAVKNNQLNKAALQYNRK